MQFKLAEALELLLQTPETLTALLGGLSNVWLDSREDAEAWSPYEVLPHLVYAEQTNWMPRLKVIQEFAESRPFEVFDRVGFQNSEERKPLSVVLNEFMTLRSQTIAQIQEAQLSDNELEKMGIHHDFGQVKLRELVATWVVDDLSHIRQITQTLARQYQTEVGPWQAYLSILKT